MKGDLAGLSRSGSAEGKLHEAFRKRADTIGLDLRYEAFPVTFWDLFGEAGHPVRTTVSGDRAAAPRALLELNEVQGDALNVVFRVGDDARMALFDLDDLRALLVWAGENAKDLTLRYGNIAAATTGAIQRKLLVPEEQGGGNFFGEPALELADMMRTDADGRGRIHVIAADRLINAPVLYATFPDVAAFRALRGAAGGRRGREAEARVLLRRGAPTVRQRKVEQVARLIRSKGVGVHFVTQEPADVPDDILGQLGNRVQHSLRAFTA